jgi:hypothetical protein
MFSKEKIGLVKKSDFSMFEGQCPVAGLKRHQYVFRQSQIVTKKFSPLDKLELKTEFGGKLFLSDGFALRGTQAGGKRTEFALQTNTRFGCAHPSIESLDAWHSAVTAAVAAQPQVGARQQRLEE